MGKRKSSKKPQVKKGPGPLSTTFDCIICSGESKINITFDTKASRALLKCGDCGTSWSRDMKGGGREHPVDVYYDWVDEAEELRLKEEERAARNSARQPHPQVRPSAAANNTSRIQPAGALGRTRRSLTPDDVPDEEEEDEDFDERRHGSSSKSKKNGGTSGSGSGSKQKRAAEVDEDEEDEDDFDEEEAERDAARKKRRLASDSEGEDD